ncbi:hypothetical protein Cni_G13588 [Canna indica]|uniref:DUF4220 domain-containing protein n=1 Tax=Canna indica TaxID=4628 RepID=A0AAQ3Q9Y9_9LILI|nr:hypothetical protein Cni_G13588 [Canna indica]
MLILGLYRRRSSSIFIKIPIAAAYVLPYSLVSYILGLMQSSSYEDELFVVWAFCLVHVLGTADSVSALTIQDSNNWKNYDIQLFLPYFWFGYLWGTYKGSTFQHATLVLWIFSILTTGFRITSLQWSSESDGLKKRTKVVADYMNYEDNFRNGGEIDPIHMRGYCYLVTGEDKQNGKAEPPEYFIQVKLTDEVITTDKIWRCGGTLLNSEQDKLKDICLSFALSKLLCRRFFNHELAESNMQKTRDLVFRGLLLENDDPERAFRVIEVELAFTYDFFYTKYPLIFERSHVPKLLSLLIAFPLIWLAVLLIKHFRNINGDITLIQKHGKNYDALFTCFIVIMILLFEILQTIVYFVSDWAKVSYVCNYISKPSWHGNMLVEKIIRVVGGVNIFKHWQNKINQYSLLTSFEYNPKRNFYSKIFDSLIDKRRKGQQEGRTITLSDAVKKAVLHSLRINNGQLSNGLLSLQRNEVISELSWACKLETHTHSILVWHIATTLCQVTRSRSLGFYDHIAILGRNKDICDVYCEVAISLSNYCAYLVVFAPQFLPDHSYATDVIFDEVIMEARKLLAGSNSLSLIYQRMMNMREPANTLVEKGALLGQQLIRQIEDERKRWKVLSDYWAEMMLFIAPSDNVTAHLEKMAEGGEFVTHLWALLTHAGILKRGDQYIV